MNLTAVNRAADNIRILAASMVEKQSPDIPAAPWVAQTLSMYFILNF